MLINSYNKVLVRPDIPTGPNVAVYKEFGGCLRLLNKGGDVGGVRKKEHARVENGRVYHLLYRLQEGWEFMRYCSRSKIAQCLRCNRIGA